MNKEAYKEHISRIVLVLLMTILGSLIIKFYFHKHLALDGVGYFGHGSAAALTDNGRVVAAIEEEKLNRIKGYVGFPYQSVEYVLSTYRVSINDLDRVALGCESIPEFSYSFYHLVTVIFRQRRFWPRKAAALISTLKQTFPEWDSSSIIENHFYRLMEKLIGIPRDKIVKVNHHLAHAASAFYCSPWDSAIIVTADGKGDGSCGGTYIGNKSGISQLDGVSDMFSIGAFYQAVTKFLGYRVNRHEGKITGLAAFGSAEETYSLLRDVLSIDENGNIRHSFYRNSQLAIDPLKYYEREVDDKSYMPVNYVRRLEGSSLRRVAIVHQLYQNFLKENMSNFPPEDVAAGVQKLAEEFLTTYAKYQLKKYTPCNVCLAGGVFANVKINQRIAELDGVQGIYVSPAMDDAGCALGAALQATAQEQGTLTWSGRILNSVYKGPCYDIQTIESALSEADLSYRQVSSVGEELAELLHAGKVIGRFSGGLEWGPRALGNRSILVRPTDKNINDSLNERLRRTEFMPFAPAILAEYATDYLVNYNELTEAARYMTVTYAVRPERQGEIAAAVHVDGTARPQVVFPEDNLSLYEIIQAYRRLSGIAAIINTSFNLHEEPIVNKPGDAIRAYLAGAVDVLSIGPFIVGA